MNLTLTEEQSILTETFTRLFANESTPERVRECEPTGHDSALWQQLVEMGTPAIRVCENKGGAALGLRDITLICYQAGYNLAPAPVIESALAAQLLSEIDSEAANQLLDQILDGSAIVSIAPQSLSFSSRQVIPYGAVADAVIALDEEQLVLVPHSAREQAEDNLGSLPLSYWDLTGNDREVLLSGKVAVELFQRILEEWKLLLAAQMAGICKRSLEYAAEYSNEREAFGVKIGSFQGLSHPLAECATAADAIQLLLDYTIWSIEQEREEASPLVAMTYWWATEATAKTMAPCMHIFGGYGVSEEHDIQLFARRGIALISILGDRQQELLTIADRQWGGASAPLPCAGESGLDFTLGDAAEKMRDRVEAFFDEHLTEEMEPYRHTSWPGYNPAMSEKLGEANLLYPQWPEEWGGLNATPAEMHALTQVFYDRRWTVFPQSTSKMVGEMIQKFGSDEIKAKILPEIIHGGAICCLGLTEPHCGSDVFAAKTRAVKQGDKWLINGQKMFTSGADIASYVMLLTNTNPDAPKHVGKTLFIVPMDHPGVEVHRVDTVSDDPTNITYYTDVEIGDEYRLGEVDSGSRVMGYMLSLEHTGSRISLEMKHLLDQAVNWAQCTERNGKRVFDDPLARTRLAITETHRMIGDISLLRIVDEAERNAPIRYHGAMLKAFIAEAMKQDAADLINMAAPDSLFTGTDDLGFLESSWRASLAACIYGGTTQVHRSVIAETYLGMPRSR